MMLRNYNQELGNLLDALVKVHISDDRFFVGTLKGVSDSGDIIIENAKNEKGAIIPKVIMHSGVWRMITVEEEPFPMEALAERIAKIFPKGHVDYQSELSIISILNGKIKVKEQDGEIEVIGEGPSAERIQKISEQFVLDLKEGKST